MNKKNKSPISAVWLISLLLLIPLSTQAAFPWGSSSERPTLAPMIKKTTPAIVNISTKSRRQIQQNPLFNDPFFRRFFDAPQAPQPQERQSMGSGVILDTSKGYILTNNHVIANADEITVTLHDKRSYKAKLVGTDPEADLAVIQIKAKDLVQLEFADSETLQVGDFVVAIGNPFGLEQTVTSGIISALGRSGLGIEGYENFIQTDASINPGNSGGALVDLDGKLVGINTAIVGPSGGNVGIGFAIPSNMAKSIMAQLIEYGEVRR
ncbi:MAG: trypsin-like peptidase domain-containing protein, partial [Thiohalomonadales bacterium]